MLNSSVKALMDLFPQHVPVDPEGCSAILENFLLGAWIVRIEYLRTGWITTFCIPETGKYAQTGLVGFPYEVTLHAADLRSSRNASSSPEDDAVTAFALFSAVPHKVVGVSVVDGSSLAIAFESGQSIVVLGVCDPVDEVWTLGPATHPGQTRGFGGPAFVQSYFGDLSADPRLL